MWARPRETTTLPRFSPLHFRTDEPFFLLVFAFFPSMEAIMEFMCLHVLCVSLCTPSARLCCLVCAYTCVCVFSCAVTCVSVLSYVCVLCRDASSALRCMAGEDRANENAAEGGLLRQRAVGRRADPATPVIPARTLRRGNCVCVSCASRALL